MPTKIGIFTIDFGDYGQLSNKGDIKVGCCEWPASPNGAS
jgi:hypothetical protein